MKTITTLIAWAIALTAATAALTSCDKMESDSSDITSAISDSWDDLDDAIRESAADAVQAVADNSEVYDKGANIEWDDVLDELTITYPYDYSSRFAMTLLLGDLGEFISDAADASRASHDVNSVTRGLNKKMANNEQIACLVLALVAREGSINYVYETDELFDNDITLDTRRLGKLLVDNGYFSSDSYISHRLWDPPSDDVEDEDYE